MTCDYIYQFRSLNQNVLNLIEPESIYQGLDMDDGRLLHFSKLNFNICNDALNDIENNKTIFIDTQNLGASWVFSKGQFFIDYYGIAVKRADEEITKINNAANN